MDAVCVDLNILLQNNAENKQTMGFEKSKQEKKIKLQRA